MSDDFVTANMFDPMVGEFALQHDFRERFYHALLEIIDVARAEGPTNVAERYRQIVGIAAEALDHDSIQKWLQDNRPLPWLDETLGEPAEELTKAVLEAIADSQTP